VKFFGRNDTRRLEAELRENRPEPRGEFVSELVGTMPEARRPARSGLRLAMVTAATTVVLTALGGFGFAASQAVNSNSNNSPQQSAYPKPGWGCGDKNHEHTGPPGNGASNGPPPNCPK
jgi:hypothetical protein